jgi:hypothetical protein
MWHPVKRLESSWNAHTPVYLHNGTKENFVFQLMLTVLLLFGIHWKENREMRAFKARYANTTTSVNQ